MDLQSFLRILGMSLGVGLVHQFAPMLAHQAEAEIADVFRAKPDPKREYSARATVSPIEGELNLQPAGCVEKRPEGGLSEPPRKRKYRAAGKEIRWAPSRSKAAYLNGGIPSDEKLSS